MRRSRAPTKINLGGELARWREVIQDEGKTIAKKVGSVSK